MPERHTIPVLNKALQVICALAEDACPPTSKEISKKLGISASTCYRILQTYSAFDWLRAGPGGRFEFSLGLLPLLKPLSRYQRMFEHLREPLEELVERSGLMAKVSIKQGTNAVTVFRVESPGLVALSSKLGVAFPLAFGSSGACLLSKMNDEEITDVLDSAEKSVWQWQTTEDVWKRISEVRAKRICFDAGSYHPKIHSVSAPVYHDGTGVLFSVSLIGWPEDFSGSKLRKLTAHLLRAVQECDAQMKTS